MNKFKLPIWLIFIIILVFILRIPSFFEPYSYGDEMIYLTLGQGIRQGIPLYSGLHDNKPPLLYLTAAVAGNLFWFKAILTFWNITTIVLFYKLTQVIFSKNLRFQIAATSILAVFTTIPLLEGNIANAEIFMVLPTIAAFYILLTKNDFKNIFIAGTLFSIAALFKIPAAFELPIIVVYWVINIKKFSFQELILLIKKSCLLFGGFLLPIILTFFWYFLNGSIKEYFIAAFAQNFGYISSWRPGDVQKPFLEKNGPLLLRALLVALLSLFFIIKKWAFSKQFLFASVWLIFSLFAVTLSERPYPHYLIQAVPAASILGAMLLTSQTYEQVLVLFPLALMFVVPVYFNFWHYPTLPYYQRFLQLVGGKITEENYLKSFGGHIPSVYKISSYVSNSTTSNDRIFVWGDTATVYALSKRLPPIKYVADYHISDFSNIDSIVQQLRNDKPKFIVVSKNSNPPDSLNYLIFSHYAFVYDFEETKVYKLIGQDLQKSLDRVP